jgi:hypothetical protein
LEVFECDWEISVRANHETLVPDAFLVYRTPDLDVHAFLEADLGTEGTKFFGQKVDRYLRTWRSGTWQTAYPLWPVVLVVTPATSRARQLKEATERVIAAQPDAGRVREGTEFNFAVLDDVHNRGVLAPIWLRAGAGPDPKLMI